MKRHETSMRLALDQAASAMEQGDFPVGCVLTAEGQIMARGKRANSDGKQPNELDHAEVVALRNLLDDYPGMDCSRITVYSTMEPCLMCYSTLLLSGVRKFVWGYEDVMGGGTNIALWNLNPLYAEMDVELTSGVLRRDCLLLFQHFFRRHSYLHGTLLAGYTLEQKV